MQLESLSIVVEQFGHQATELAELGPVKPLDPMLIYDTSILVNQEALQRNETAELVNDTATSLRLLEAEWVLNIVVEERTEHFKWIEVELFDGERHRDVASLVKILAGKDLGSSHSVDDVARFRIDQVTIVIDRSAVEVSAPPASSLVIIWHNYVAFLVAVQVTKDVDLVEVSPLVVLIRRLNVRNVEGACLVSRVHHAHALGAWCR